MSVKGAPALPAGLIPICMTRPATAKYISVSPATFDVLVKTGIMPPPLRLGVRRKLWDRRQIDQAIEKLARDGAELPMAPEAAEQAWKDRIRHGPR